MPSTEQKIVRPCLETTPLKEVYDRVFPTPKSDINIVSTDEQQQPTTGEIFDNTNSHRNFYFYLHRHRAVTKDTILVPLQPSATLRDVLRGRSVLEFPTIYILSEDLRQQQQDTKAADAEASTSTDKRRYVLEEVYLRDHPDEAESESGEEEEEDFTSSEGSSSEESSDDNDKGEDEDGSELEAEDKAEAEVTSVHGTGSADQDEVLADQP